MSFPQLQMLLAQASTGDFNYFNALGNSLAYIMAALGGAGAALLIVLLAFRRQMKTDEERRLSMLHYAKEEAELIVREGRVRAESEAKAMRDEVNEECNAREVAIAVREREQESLGESLRRLQADVEKRSDRLNAREDEIEERRLQAEQRLRELRRSLETVGDLTREQARERLREDVRKEVGAELADYKKQELNRSEQDIRSEAQGILVVAMQRLATDVAHEYTSTKVLLPSEDMKGRLIGREGRNIKAFENLSGVTLLVDEYQDGVQLSSFDPIRREIAREALQALLDDGRISPVTIEDAIKSSKEGIEAAVLRYGEETISQLHLDVMPQEVSRLVGALKFRQSFSQNLLQHSIEVAYLSSLIAQELGLDPVIAKTAGLLHDIGKCVAHEREGTHALIGAQILRGYDFDPRVVNAVAAHHGEVKPESVYAPIVTLADSISSSRPGARAEPVEALTNRVRRLESLVKEFPGVREAFALQAGRELRVIVEPEKLSDEDAHRLCRTLRNRIEDTCNYNGQIKVIVIREARFSDTAR